jgi:hypothetical protein
VSFEVQAQIAERLVAGLRAAAPLAADDFRRFGVFAATQHLNDAIEFGRDIDAAKAFLVELAVTSNLDRTCQTVLGAYATYGERLRVPVEAMLNRVDASGRISPYCDRRPSWAAAKLQ